MLSKTAEAERMVESLRERIEEERRDLRARLAARPPRKRGARTKERGRLRQLLRAWDELLPD